MHMCISSTSVWIDIPSVWSLQVRKDYCQSWPISETFQWDSVLGCHGDGTNK